MCHLLDFACGYGDMTRKSVVAEKLRRFGFIIFRPFFLCLIKSFYLPISITLFFILL